MSITRDEVLEHAENVAVALSTIAALAGVAGAGRPSEEIAKHAGEVLIAILTAIRTLRAGIDDVLSPEVVRERLRSLATAVAALDAEADAALAAKFNGQHPETD